MPGIPNNTARDLSRTSGGPMDTWIWIVIAVAVVAIILLVAMSAMAKSRRRAHLKDRFGSEYDRTIDDADNRRQAERELRDRESRHDQLELKPLTPAARDRY